MNEIKTLGFDWEFGHEELALQISSYANNGCLYVGLYKNGEEGFEPFGDLTVNLPMSSMLPPELNEAYISGSFSREKLKFIKKHKLGVFLPEVGFSGYCTYAKVAFDMERLKEFDPKGMEDFFNRLAKENRYYENDVTAFLSTHPLSSERMSDMQNRSRNVKRSDVASSLDFYLVRARARVLQETGYDGWLKLSKIFADETKTLKGRELAAAYYGEATALSRMNRPAAALTALKNARSAAGISSLILEKALAETAFAAAQTPAEKASALKTARATAAAYPDSAMAASSCAELLWQAGDNAGVVSFLRRQTALPHNDPDYSALLARSYEALGQKSAAFAATGDMYAQAGNHRAAVYQFDLAQKANDGDFYLMSEIDAKLREERRRVLDEKADAKR